MTAQAFIRKYGTDGLLEAIGNRKTGQIARGHDWANVAELLELLKRKRMNLLKSHLRR